MAHIYAFGQRDTEGLYIHLNVSGVIPTKSGISLLYREVVGVTIWVKNTLWDIFKLLREAKSYIKSVDSYYWYRICSAHLLLKVKL